jgi:GntR family transcriptional regulator
MPPIDRIRDHVGQGATTVAAHRARRRLRADRARQLTDLLRHQLLTGGLPRRLWNSSAGV